MTDVRLTALNPVDSQVYPVACNTSGELIVEQVVPGPDLTVTGDLTVDGTSTFIGSISGELATFARTTIVGGDARNGGEAGVALTPTGNIQVAQASGTSTIISGYIEGNTKKNVAITAAGDATFVGRLKTEEYYLSDNASAEAGFIAYNDTGAARTDAALLISNSGSASGETAVINYDGSATFAGDIACSNSNKGLILKSPDGTAYLITVANNGTLVIQ